MIKGVIFATWVSRIPMLKATHSLDDFTLGVTLLAVAGGSVVAMPLAGRAIARVGSRAFAVASAFALSGLLAIVFVVQKPVPFALTLIAFGAANGVMDVAINAQGAAVEALYRRPMLSSMHSAFSIGTITGAVAASTALHADLGSVAHAAVVGGLCACVALGSLSRLLGPSYDASSSGGSGNRRTLTWPLIACSLIGFSSLFCEGAIGDWSGVYLTGSLGAPGHSAAYGFAAFSVTMTLGRATGDRLAQRLGHVLLMRLSALLLIAGSATMLATSEALVAIVGFGVAGLGLANVQPNAVSAASRMPEVRPSDAIATVTTVSYIAVMAGPGLIGVLSGLGGLRTALATMPVLALAILSLAGGLRSAQAPGTSKHDAKRIPVEPKLRQGRRH